MTTATTTYEVKHEPCDDGYDWHVYDADGDVVASFKGRKTALVHILKLEARDAREAKREAKEEQLAALRRKLEALADSCEDPGKLRAALALLK